MIPISDLAIYVDMDGVMADFETGIAQLGFKIDPSIKNDLNRSGSDNPLKRQMYDTVKGTHFYRTLPILPGAIELWAALEPAHPITLTAAPKFGATEDDYYLNPFWLGAAYNKRRWMEDDFLPEVMEQVHHTFVFEQPIEDHRFICTTSARKWQFMHRKHSPYQVLFDDRIANCRAWIENGGFAILYDGDVQKALQALDKYRAGA